MSLKKNNKKILKNDSKTLFIRAWKVVGAFVNPNDIILNL
jgi:hypothetical protein